MDRSSSPAFLRSSLPPSSAPPHATSSQTPRRTRPSTDALALDDVPTDPAQDEAGPSRRRGARARGTLNNDVSLVRDVLGDSVTESFETFLKTFTENVDLAMTPMSDGDALDTEGDLIYVAQIHTMKDYELTTLYVDFGHILQKDEVLAHTIQGQYYRFLPFLRRALQNLVAEYEPEYVKASPNASAGDASAQAKEFSIAFYQLPLVSSVRELRTNKLGQLMSISGTVTRTSEVRPELLYGSFVCEVCGGLVNEIEQQFKYTEPSLCPNPTCGNRTAWQLQIDSSKFTDWQKVRIQENASEIPTGSMPRSLDVVLRGELVERAKAGDKCVFTGAFIVVPDVAQMSMPGERTTLARETKSGPNGANGAGGAGVTGLKNLGVRDLQYKTAFLACMVRDIDGRSGTNIRGEQAEGEDDQKAFLRTLTEPESEELFRMIEGDHIYSRLVESIAPTVYGHDIVKKGLLLQLMGGVHKQTPEGMHLRGDINICIVGDPSTSKSQFLKYVCSFLPRAVYTSGKASSAAGLTAAVVRDEETGDFTIEAGALMLADNGICAIDEFDKMDISDQVAIHEAMEQQTISIAKAGIQATLNARTSILAAANPVNGRYDRKKTLRANVMMSAPIMSRFDLFFVVLDECDERTDFNLARHIVNVHRFQDEAINPEFSTEALQRYIRYARTFNPKMTPEAADLLVEKYRSLRQDDATGAGRNSYRITVRQLESMIRLSEAIARANCTDEITPAFVREAYTLLKQSIIHVEQDDVDFDDEDAQANAAEVQAQLNGAADIQDVEMGADDDPSSTRVPSSGDGSQVVGGSSTAVGRSSSQEPAPAPVRAAPRKKTKITHDKFMSLRSLIVLHLAAAERENGRGLEREELVDWYLELKESEVQDVDELEEEKELIGKMLKKLVKDNYLIEIRGDVQDSLPSAEDNVTNQEDVRVYYMVHPSVDAEESSQL